MYACDRGSDDWPFFVDVINGRPLIQCPKRIIYDVSEWTEIQNSGSIENDVKAVKSYGKLKGLKKHPWSEKKTAIHTNGSRCSRMDQIKFVKGCLPHILLGPFWITLTQTTDTGTQSKINQNGKSKESNVWMQSLHRVHVFFLN